MLHSLHELGVDIEWSDIRGRTPLHLAAQNGHVEVLKAWHELGCDLVHR